MYCHCCQTRIFKEEIAANGGQCPECGTVPQWDSILWTEDIKNSDDPIEEEREIDDESLSMNSD